MLAREWNGVTHRVIVLEEGFTWNGQKYDSLTEIAFRITGTRWSGRASSVCDNSPSHDHASPVSVPGATITRRVLQRPAVTTDDK